jgi:hypothetical protein
MRPCAWRVARTAWRSSDRLVLTLKPVEPSNIHVASSRSTWSAKWVVRLTVVAVREAAHWVARAALVVWAALVV